MADINSNCPPVMGSIVLPELPYGIDAVRLFYKAHLACPTKETEDALMKSLQSMFSKMY